MDRSPSLADLVLAALESRLANVNVALPGIVQSYDPVRQSVDVQPAIGNYFYDESGDRTPERLPLIPGVPVCFPGSGGSSITWPIAPGDTCLLVFAHRHIDAFLNIGGENLPTDDRMHHIGDAVAIVGLRSFSKPITPAPSTSALAIKTGVDVTVTSGGSMSLTAGTSASVTATTEATVDAASVKLGSLAIEPVVVQSALDYYTGALTLAIANVGPLSAAAIPLVALKDALGGTGGTVVPMPSAWLAGTLKAKAE